MIKKGMGIIMLVFFLVGCQANALAPPENIRVEDSILVWDAVEGASSYVVKIQEEEHTTQTASFDLSVFPEGTYQIFVQSVKGTKTSVWSSVFVWNKEALDFQITNLSYQNAVLSWNSLGTEVSYWVRIEEEEYHVETALFDFAQHDIPINQMYTVGVRADQDDSLESSIVVYYYQTRAEQTRSFLTTSLDELFFLLELEQGELHRIFLGQDIIEYDLFHVMNESLWVDTLFLQSFEESLAFVIDTSLGRTVVHVTYVEERMPHIVSENQIQYIPMQDVAVTFALYQGSFDLLVGNDITETDYRIENGILTIDASYFEAILQENPDRQTVILQYYLSFQEESTWGYLVIRMQ